MQLRGGESCNGCGKKPASSPTLHNGHHASTGFELFISLVSSCAARRIHQRVFGRKIASDADDQEFQRPAAIVGERFGLVEPDRDGVSAMDWSCLRIYCGCAIAGDDIVDLAHVRLRVRTDRTAGGN